MFNNYLPLYQRQRVSIHIDNHIFFLSFLLQDFSNSDLIRYCQHIQSRDFRVVLCAFARALDRQNLIVCLLESPAAGDPQGTRDPQEAWRPPATGVLLLF